MQPPLITKNVPLGMRIFGITEILIGISSFTFNFLLLFSSLDAKPLNILLFVLSTGFLSGMLGIGLFNKNGLSIELLKYFSFSIILTKLLIFAGILSFQKGVITNFVGEELKNAVSVIYHLSLLLYLDKEKIVDYFRKKDER